MTAVPYDEFRKLSARVEKLEALVSTPTVVVQDEKQSVHQLGEAIGYGRLMHLAAEIWAEKDPKGALTVGPCASLLVKCPQGSCYWCQGTEKLTKPAAEALALMQYLYSRTGARDALQWVLDNVKAVSDWETSQVAKSTIAAEVLARILHWGQR